TAAYGAGFRACAQSGQWVLALDLLRRVKSQNTDQAKDPFLLLLAARSVCMEAGQWERALELGWESVERGLEPDVISCNVMLTALERLGRWRDGLSILDDMISRKMQPTSSTYGSLIPSGSDDEDSDSWLRAIGLFEASLAQGLEPCVITCGKVINSCGRCGHWELALQWLWNMHGTFGM
ncbi:unnamed protein product, partial [Polarella glacialis]